MSALLKKLLVFAVLLHFGADVLCSDPEVLKHTDVLVQLELTPLFSLKKVLHARLAAGVVIVVRVRIYITYVGRFPKILGVFFLVFDKLHKALVVKLYVLYYDLVVSRRALRRLFLGFPLKHSEGRLEALLYVTL